MVREAIARAGHHGFKVERHVCKFVDLFFTFGEQLNTDPALEWAQAILSDTSIASPAERIRQALRRSPGTPGTMLNSHGRTTPANK
ncbi:MAG: hypothetical protein IPK83_10310 [Planctomycetes bacterium]|nr:hypothetical protein [Planctomycetota bacterium]